jgi:hypothetical protein
MIESCFEKGVSSVGAGKNIEDTKKRVDTIKTNIEIPR